MRKLTVSDKYGLAATVGLIIMLVVNNTIVMLAISVLGIMAGFWVLRQGEVRRVAFVAFIAFVVAAVFAVFALVRAG